MTSSERMICLVDRDICNGSVRWMSVVMVSVLTKLLAASCLRCVNCRVSPNPLSLCVSSCDHCNQSCSTKGRRASVQLLSEAKQTLPKKNSLDEKCTISIKHLHETHAFSDSKHSNITRHPTRAKTKEKSSFHTTGNLKPNLVTISNTLTP